MKKLSPTLLFAFVCSSLFGQLSFDTASLNKNLKYLSSDALEGRKTGSAGGKTARIHIIEQLKKIGIEPYTPNYIQAFTVSTGDAANILAVIPGKKKETIVISAHYDHLGIRNGIIFNGADDNASGVSALLTMAEYFKKNKPEHRLIFAFFDAEEMGLRGSAHFVKNTDLQKEKIVLNINLDMVGRSEKNELYACGGFHYPEEKKKIENLKTPAGISLLFGHDDPALGNNDWTNQSDHYNFHQQKIPFVYFGVEDHPDYHRATDDFEKINTVFFARSVETILRCIQSLDR